MFPTSDGHINIAASSARVFGRFCEAIGKPEWKDKPEWKTQEGRSEHRKEINAAIGEITQAQAGRALDRAARGAGIPCGPIYTIDQVFADPQVKHLGMATTMQSARRSAKPRWWPRRSTSPGSRRTSAGTRRMPASITDEVLASVGYSDAEIAEMREKGAI